MNKNDLEDNRYFIPTKTVAWIIGAQKYDKVRSAGKRFANFKNLDQVPQDIKGMSNFFHELKFDEIITTMDPCFEDIED